MKKILYTILAIGIIFFAAVWFLGDDEDFYDYDSYAGEEELYGEEDYEEEEASLPAQSLQLLNEEAVREKKVVPKGNGEDRVTILIYMNGSDLETKNGQATEDLTEMVSAGSSDKVNIVVQTMNTKKWEKKYGIRNDRSQIYEVNGDGLTLVKDDLGQLKCTDYRTLRDFIRWGTKNYPADRYILQFWNHGGGPVYGFGFDDKTEAEDQLTLDEMQRALREAETYFDFIGMDCCLMSSMEVACALYDFCDYMVLSEDFESGLGWSYKNWLSKLYENSSTSTPELGKIIIDDMVASNANGGSRGDDSIMALVDMSMMKVLYQTWTNFAYANEDALKGNNYSRKRSRPMNARVHPALKRSFWDALLGDSEEYDDPDDAGMADYYITDIMSVASTVGSEEAKALAAAVSSTLVYVDACGDDVNLAGISVSLPYGDRAFYEKLSEVFGNCGFDKEYIQWLSGFVSASGSEEYYDYNQWDDDWNGWDEYEDDFDWGDWFDDYDDDYWENDDSWGWELLDLLLD